MTHAWGIKRTREGEKEGYLIDRDGLGLSVSRCLSGFPGFAYQNREDARVRARALNEINSRYHYAPVKIQIMVREIG